jgi:hypothetical protein
VSICLIGIGTHLITYTQQQQPNASLTSTEQQHLLDGISFQIDNVTFTDHMATVNGIQLHYLMGGKGDPLVLLHGLSTVMVCMGYSPGPSDFLTVSLGILEIIKM